MRSLRRIGLVSLVVLMAAIDRVPLLSHEKEGVAQPSRGRIENVVPILSPGRPPIHPKPIIGEYRLVRVVRVTHTINEFVYRASLKNGETALAGATASAVSLAHGTTIGDGSLTFGPVGARGTVVSSDTFSVRHHREKPFNPLWPTLRWTITPIVGSPAPNRPPVANAGPDQAVSGVSTRANLNGSGSSDPDGNPLNFHWTLTRPVGSTATLSSPTAMNPWFMPDRRGNYQADLVVDDGSLVSAPDAVMVTVGNTAPVANAGADFNIFVTQTAALNGGASSDADGDSLSFNWSFVSRPAGSAAVLSDPTTNNPTFLVDRPGQYVVRLVVNDGTVDSASDSVTVTTQNTAPAADAGPDQTAPVGTMITLNGSGSNDLDGDALSYAWAFQSRPAGSSSSLSSSTSVNPTFTIDQPGSYVVRLVVNDGSVNSAPDTVAINTVNSAPVAHAGADQTALVTQSVTLDGSASSDVDGNPLTFAWTFAARPAGSTASLSNPTAVNPTFVVDRPGTYHVQLVVNDGALNSAADVVQVTTLNSAPVANAGPDQSALVTTTVTLDGSGSTDVDGDALTYVWALTSTPSGSAAALSNPTAVMPTFVVDRAGSYVAQLIVSDSFGPSAADTVTITTRNSPPVANAGPDQSLVAGQIVMLDGIASTDVDGDVLSFDWSFTVRPSGSTAILANSTTSAPTFQADRPGVYVVQLIVNDGTVNSAPDTVMISTTNTNPVANAGSDQLGLFVGPVMLDGSVSSDADGHPLTYQWSLLSSPTGSSAALSGATLVNPTFTADRPGDYVAQLIVNDGFVDSAPDTVLIRVVNRSPVADAGLDQSVLTGATVSLNGSSSSDPDGQPLTYQWVLTKPMGSLASLSGAATATPTFVPDVAGIYTVDLTVTDTSSATATDAVVVTAVAPPTVTLAATDTSAAESGSNPGTFTFTRTGPTTASLTVFYSVNGTAANGGDYTPTLSGSVTIPSGQASADVTVTPVDDAEFEGNETVSVTLAADAAYVVGTPSPATVTIADNDKPVVTIQATDTNASEIGPDTGTFTIYRTGTTLAPLTVSLGGPYGGAAFGSDYTLSPWSTVTIPAGQSSAVVTVTPVVDAISPEGIENVEITINPDPSYTVGAQWFADVFIAAN